jgi:hypothetical protein
MRLIQACFVETMQKSKIVLGPNFLVNFSKLSIRDDSIGVRKLLSPEICQISASQGQFQSLVSHVSIQVGYELGSALPPGYTGPWYLLSLPRKGNYVTRHDFSAYNVLSCTGIQVFSILSGSLVYL